MTTITKSEKGVVLITTLIMLVLMTLLTLSLVRTSVIELKIGGASQISAQNLANAELAIWTFINAPTNQDKFAHGATMDVTVGQPAGVTLSATEVECTEDSALGSGNNSGVKIFKVYFDVRADTHDTIFSGHTVVHQGIFSTVPSCGHP